MKTEKILPSTTTISGLKIRPRSGWKIQPRDMETPIGVSKTQQNLSPKIRDLMIKHTNGIDMLATADTFNAIDSSHEDEDYNALERLDMVDRDIIHKQQILKQELINQQLKQNKETSASARTQSEKETKGGTTDGTTSSEDTPSASKDTMEAKPTTKKTTKSS